MSNYEEFMKALRVERQHELRVAQALGLTQRHLLKPYTRLVPLPPNPTANFFPTTPAWISQIEHHLFTPELNAAIVLAEDSLSSNQLSSLDSNNPFSDALIPSEPSDINLDGISSISKNPISSNPNPAPATCA